MDQKIRERIEQDVKGNKVFLYMKGTPEAPMCGFSARAVDILKQYKVPFKAFNVFEDEAIRQGIKEYADWPTIPQLYINGEFIGGCDILTEMHGNGELKKLIGA
jgi:monothiol glutaredoxin